MLKLFKLICSGVGAAGATFLLQILLSHKLSLNDYGIYATANSSISMIGPFAGMGIGGLFLRKACIDHTHSQEYFSIALKCILINILIAFTASQFIFYNTGLNILQALCLSSYCLPIAFQYLVISQAQSLENFTTVSIAQIINPLLRVFVVLFLVVLIPSLTNTVILLCVANSVSFIIMLRLIDKKLSFRLIFLKQSKEFFFRFLKESFFYSFNGTINVIQIQFSIIMAMCLFGSNSAGLYSSAIILLTACYILPNITFGTYLLPKYHKLDNAVLKTISLKHGGLAFLGGIVFFIAISVLSGDVIKLIYPDSFKNSTQLLNILAISLPFRFYSTAIGAALLNERCIKYKVSASSISVVFQAMLMFFLQKIGETSISISFVISEVLTAILYTLIFLRYFKNK
ncbi:oligosaccharide flippase family protein [Flavobacterium reichenbachii]|uniref:Polysaccharide biosynthesis protein C-terminal domain-containing protein n=1 Tax=Flavobacterium reichenbachii TaxID=362418 RepID=A0A085ZDD2_9FLAO|nr:oligosaccharide flippase family protein [Flavobacterium reichenbachii]KFF02446.1 hypothetical protein IW19_24455 [Flavobacterium reichenbachii]OXB13576.1 hypothetical protein B0A68_14595 [Flavobacterium reichenbachii]